MIEVNDKVKVAVEIHGKVIGMANDEVLIEVIHIGGARVQMKVPRVIWVERGPVKKIVKKTME